MILNHILNNRLGGYSFNCKEFDGNAIIERHVL